MTLPRYDSTRQLDARLKALRARIMRALEEESPAYTGFIPAAKWAQGDLWEPSSRPVQLEDSKGRAMKSARTNAIADPTGAQVARLANGVAVLNQHQARKRKDYDAAFTKVDRAIRELESAVGLLDKVMGDRRPRTERDLQDQELADTDADLRARLYGPDVPKRYLRRGEQNQAKEREPEEGTDDHE